MRNICLVVCFSLLYSCTFAKDGIAISPEPSWLVKITPDFSKRPDSRSINNGYYLELLDNETNLETQTEYTHFIRRLVNETGVQNASEISVRFSPAYQKVIFHRLVVTRDGRVVSNLSAEQIQVVQEETDAEDFIYNGIKRAFVILKNIRKNDRIEGSYSIIGFNPVFSNRFSASFFFYSSTPITNYYETIIAPRQRRLNFTPLNMAPMPAESASGNNKIFHWDNPQMRLVESQPSVPSWFNNYPRMEVSEFNSWEEVIKWGTATFNDYQYELPAALKAKIMRWRKMAHGDQDIFAGYAIRYVQDEIRYLGLEIGEHTHLPHPPAEVFENGFGDCKDKALLLATILQQENIPSYVALVDTELKRKIIDGAPAANVFDHAIVAMERGSGYIFVDATVSLQRGELVNLYVPPYGFALVLKKGETGLVKMDENEFNSSVITENLEVSDEDSSHLNVETKYFGGKADAIRSSLSGTSPSDLEESYVQYYKGLFDGIRHLAPIASHDDTSKNIFTVRESYVMPPIWKNNNKGKEYFSVYAKVMNENIPDPSQVVANTPLALSYPGFTEYTLNLKMPSLWDFPIEPVHILNDYYQFDYTVKVAGNLISLRYYFKTFQDNIPAGAIAQYKSDYSKMIGTLEYELNRTTAVGPSAQGDSHQGLNDDSINWIAVWVTFFVLAGMSFVFRTLNKQELEVGYDRESGYRLGGWIILLGVSLGLSVLLQAYFLLTGKFYSMTGWVSLGNAGQGLQAVSLVELGLALVWLSQGLALSYWYLNRRDIFRKYFLWYVGTMIGGNAIKFLLLSSIHYPESFGDLRTSAGQTLIRSCIYGAIWGTYVLRSQRARGTFLRNA